MFLFLNLVCKNCGEDVVGPLTLIDDKPYCKQCGEEMSKILDSLKKN